jgi:hypothetical protein
MLPLVAAAVVMIVMIGGLLGALSGSGQPTPTTLPTALMGLVTNTAIIAATAAPTIAQPAATTLTPTDPPAVATTAIPAPITATPLSPSPTEAPATVAATSLPTEPGQATAQTAAPDIRMMYIRSQVSLLNVSGRMLDLSKLVFVQRGAQERRFAALEWEGTIGALNSPRQTPNGRCFQIARLEVGSAQPVGDCNRVAAYRVVNASKQFWVAQNSQTIEFEVLWDEVSIARCTISNGACDFSLPTN